MGPKIDVHGLVWIDGASSEPDLEVKVWSRRTSCGPDLADIRSGGDEVAFLHVNSVQVGVSGLDPKSVVDVDDPTVAAIAAGASDDAGTSSVNRLAALALEVEALMKAAPTSADRVSAHAEGRGQLTGGGPGDEDG